MSQIYESTGGRGRTETREYSGWAVGWTAFAGILMAIQGFWWLMVGFIALLNDEFFVQTPNYVLQFDATTWAWIHMAIGLAVGYAGIALFRAATWARVVGVIVAGLAMLAAFAWLPWYPVWGVMFVVSSACVIWALTTHGTDIAH